MLISDAVSRKMSTRLLVFLIIIAHPFASKAQNFVDVLRYSENNYLATAYSSGLAGAMAASGADFASVLYNPAGIGMFRQNQYNISLGYQAIGANTSYLGSESRNSASKLQVPNVGMVFSIPRYKLGQPVKEGVRYVNLAFGYQKTANYNSTISYNGINRTSSILDAWENSAQGYSPEELSLFDPAYMAYRLQLLKLVEGSGNNYTNIVDSSGAGPLELYQEDVISTEGRRNNFYGSVALNISDKIYLGGTLGLDWTRYRYLREFREVNNNFNRLNYDGLIYTDEVSTHLFGVKVNLGAIFVPIPQLRIAAAFRSPTNYSVDDEYVRTLIADFTNGPTNNSYTPIGEYESTLTTSPEITLGASYILTAPHKGKEVDRVPLGMINLDFTYQPLRDASIRADGDPFTDVNNDINNILLDVYKVSLGGEAAYAQYRFRGGISYTTSSYAADFRDEAGDHSSILGALGFGYRAQDIAVDLSYTRSVLYLYLFALLSTAHRT